MALSDVPEFPCPTPKCPGVLRYPLQARLDGDLVRCRPKVPSLPATIECTRTWQWDAAREEWRSVRRAERQRKTA
jgi:hypothetical protein